MIVTPCTEGRSCEGAAPSRRAVRCALKGRRPSSALRGWVFGRSRGCLLAVGSTVAGSRTVRSASGREPLSSNPMSSPGSRGERVGAGPEREPPFARGRHHRPSVRPSPRRSRAIATRRGIRLNRGRTAQLASFGSNLVSLQSFQAHATRSYHQEPCPQPCSALRPSSLLSCSWDAMAAAAVWWAGPSPKRGSQTSASTVDRARRRS